ncbi:hypothetical protein [Enterococcus columbae]|uniref:Uncharacterized protein n=1 Tax=Enterococcus columbae DSM 7374 = ATCC 51263 TaxID=1121865 RepID=S0KZ80_9ENTE|nr:hypothetical protein [Enterococcus columbae]EOT44591.1 hypothetical protein OMW_00647 [Enterococcus columbae DSM 7374 = ATCC 51263]EOW87513.1 hypothetical protein I568_00557 [Enterococcus columbae DSM 7374 = ATCC 51263]
MKMWLNQFKSKKSLVLCFLGVFIFGGSFYLFMNHRMQEEKRKTLEEQLAFESSLVEKIQKEFDQAYIDNNQVFLAKEFAEKDLNELESNLKVYQDKMSEINDSWHLLGEKTTTPLQPLKQAIEKPKHEFLKNFKSIKRKFYAQNHLNQLFNEKYLYGDTINKNVVIIDSLEPKSIQMLKKKYVFDKNNPFDHVIQEGLNLAEEQLKLVTETKQSIEEMFTNSKPNDKATIDNLTHAKDLLSRIKNQKIVSQLNNRLSPVEAKLKKEKDEKQEKIKQELETKAKETGGTVEKQSDGSYVLKSNDGNTTQSGTNTQQSSPTESANQSSNQASNSQSSTQNGSTNTQPSQPTPQPQPQPTVKYTVWYTASNPADAQYNLLTGQKVFNTEAEATSWLDNYADSLLMKNITSSSYGVSTYIG